MKIYKYFKVSDIHIILSSEDLHVFEGKLKDSCNMFLPWLLCHLHLCYLLSRYLSLWQTLFSFSLCLFFPPFFFSYKTFSFHVLTLKNSKNRIRSSIYLFILFQLISFHWATPFQTPNIALDDVGGIRPPIITHTPL